MRQIRYQAGGVLVASLVLMTTMSLLAVSNANQSILSDRIATNHQQFTQALFTAESALATAIHTLDVLVITDASYLDREPAQIIEDLNRGERKVAGAAWELIPPTGERIDIDGTRGIVLRARAQIGEAGTSKWLDATYLPPVELEATASGASGDASEGTSGSDDAEATHVTTPASRLFIGSSIVKWSRAP